jgi:hypothetical protein
VSLADDLLLDHLTGPSFDFVSLAVVCFLLAFHVASTSIIALAAVMRHE